MRILQARVVTLCQQLLAFGVVLAVLTPASGVVSLDIVAGDAPRAAGSAGPATLVSATVPSEAVEPEVTEVPLTTDAGNARPLAGDTVSGDSVSDSSVVSKPQAVSGFAAVGVTWENGEQLEDEEIALQVRTRTGEAWGEWQELEYHDEHGPDAGSAEALEARPGTEPLFVGEVDDVQVKASTEGTSLPDDMSVALISPGEAEGEKAEAPAIKGAAPNALQRDASATRAYEKEFEEQGGADGIVLRAARTIAQPTIFSRAQWGADERIRDASNPSYGTVNAGFVHHTVNANEYTEADVPGIIRSIYAYHVKSRGWRDIGYNFLVDRFGRIWEGRYGGIDRPVIGAHTLGYNHASFAMSAIGNFDVVQPTDEMLRAYGQLFAWKLSLHGVNPASMSQKVGKSTFAAINGHRDAGSTACPGKYLYARIPSIRQYSAEAAPAAPVGVAVSEPAPQSSLVGTPHPDLVVRRASDGQGLVLPTGGLTSFGKRAVIGKRKWNTRADVLVSPDLTGDGVVDLVTSDGRGTVRVRPGKAGGRFGNTTKKVRTTRGHALLAAVGDTNGDGRNDLVARRKGKLVLFKGTAKGGFSRKVLDRGFGNAVQLLGVGDVNSDGHVDVMARRKGSLNLYPGTGSGTFGARQRVAGTWGSYDRIIGGDYTGDGRPDLLARRTNGSLYLLPGNGDGTFGAARGPASNLRSMRFLTAGGNLLGGPGGDLVGVSGQKLMVVTNRDTFELGSPIDTGVSFAGLDLVLNAGDVNRDGLGDVLGRTPAGQLMLFTGNGQGGLAPAGVLGEGWNAVADLKAVGDVTGDGLPDLVGTLDGPKVWPGNGSGFGAASSILGRIAVSAGLPQDLSRFDWLIGVSDMQLRGGMDYVAREPSTGRLYFYNGKQSGASRARVLGEGMGAYDLAG
ncbi:hypothetical protein EXE58_13170 [Nocardioides seonyuensis]|uniref:Peptidoglycan recognition protein family domain-containing protein n=1 Tax=Nocardioides seonyuensis TaxID=2518371 RepID=A0A4P7IG99_9ACTN|nr:FG-GAP-like repeat-containing protein [Nocardioides seonyuensis]QBX56325.1 hypothetical protein EXE58_13170 [Nocardioides seonyuensis]